MDDLILHEDPVSANCYKVRLTAALLSRPLERRIYDIFKGDTRTPDFLERVSAYGRLPVLQIGSSTFLPESNAACYYLATTSSPDPMSLIPSDPLERSRMLQWMFFEQNRHENNIAVLRHWIQLVGEDKLSEERKVQLPEKRRASKEILDYMEISLAHSEWFVGSSPSLADVCLYAYTHVVHEIGYELSEFPNIAKWCSRIELLPRYVAMGD